MSADKMYIVVEGDAEEHLAGVWSREYLKYTQCVIRNARGRQKAASRAGQWWQQAQDAGAHLLIFWSDQESHPCPPAAADAFLKRLPPEAQDHVLVIITARALEAWYLADARGLARVCPDIEVPSEADTALIRDPKARLASLLREAGAHRRYKFLDFAEDFAPHFSLARAAQSNASAKRAVRRLAEVAPYLRDSCAEYCADGPS